MKRGHEDMNIGAEMEEIYERIRKGVPSPQ